MASNASNWSHLLMMTQPGLSNCGHCDHYIPAKGYKVCRTCKHRVCAGCVDRCTAQAKKGE